MKRNTKELEVSLTLVNSRLSDTASELQKLKQSFRNSETEVEELQQKLRARESELEHTKELYRNTLENLAITTSELEALQDSKLEDTQRLKDSLAEVTQELLLQRRSDVKSGSKPVSLSLVENLIQKVASARCSDDLLTVTNSHSKSLQPSLTAVDCFDRSRPRR
mmetsp:Transcript_11957/g.22894  ORF Transcript_11957/g.22894 Transcript_11957/m.22894 type:complete len:165 (-) Transcript_11957:306-800(-)